MITSYQYLHNQGIAHLQPGYRPPPQGEPTKLPAAVSDLGKMLVDQAAQMAAENLASKYIGPVAGSALKKANFLLGIFDPFPPPAGGPGDMILEPMMPTPPPDLPWEDNSPCKYDKSTGYNNGLKMKEYVFAILAFAILWPAFFFSALVYHNNFEVLKKVVRLDFKGISKVGFWMSFFISLFIAAVISYSLL